MVDDMEHVEGEKEGGKRALMTHLSRTRAWIYAILFALLLSVDWVGLIWGG